jgi:hypothetical protein
MHFGPDPRQMPDPSREVQKLDFSYSSTPKQLVWPTLDLPDHTQTAAGAAELELKDRLLASQSTLTSLTSQRPRSTLDWRRFCLGSQAAPRLKLVFGALTQWPLIELVKWLERSCPSSVPSRPRYLQVRTAVADLCCGC